MQVWQVLLPLLHVSNINSTFDMKMFHLKHLKWMQAVDWRAGRKMCNSPLICNCIRKCRICITYCGWCGLVLLHQCVRILNFNKGLWWVICKVHKHLTQSHIFSILWLWGNQSSLTWIFCLLKNKCKYFGSICHI